MQFESPPALANLTGQSGVATPVNKDSRDVLLRSLVTEFNDTDSQGLGIIPFELLKGHPSVRYFQLLKISNKFKLQMKSFYA